MTPSTFSTARQQNWLVRCVHKQLTDNFPVYGRHARVMPDPAPSET